MFGKNRKDREPDDGFGLLELPVKNDEAAGVSSDWSDEPVSSPYVPPVADRDRNYRYAAQGPAKIERGGFPEEDTAVYTDGYVSGPYTEEPANTGEQPDTEEPEEKPVNRTIFKASVRKPLFIFSVLLNIIRVLGILVIVIGFAALGAVVGIARGYVDTAPELNLAALDGQAQTSFIYDCNGELITEYKGTENRVMISLNAMPVTLRNAFVAVEDARFFSHSGVDLKRIVGAFVSNLSSSATQGGSTITQQLIKNTLLSAEQSYKRKIQEAWLAMQLEMKYSKDEILESYLNTIYLGENYYGVQTAAEGYFGRSLGELTLRECAMLAGVTNSPYYYNPRRNFYFRAKEGVNYPDITNNRTDYVLRCMYENQFITYEQYTAALDRSTAKVLKESPTGGDAMYPYAHYVEYAVSEAVDILLQLNGLENTSVNRAAMENKLRTGGYRVKLALDPTIQSTVEDTLTNWSKYPSLRDPSDKVYRARNADGTYTEIIQPQAAAVVLDYRTGELKAIVGSRDKVTARKTLNRATDMKMPVGSSIKPIAVYAPALELGKSPASVVFNMPLPISGWKDAKGNDSWPTNYGGGGYVGPETLREAMKKSHNTAAAYTLVNYVSVERSVDFLHRMGIDDAHIDATPFGLSLGSSGITPLQMTVAYGVLANGGVYQEPISILGISDSTGSVIWDGHQNQDRRRVFSESTAYMTVDMMKTVVSSGTGTSAKISGQTVAGKTGTNSDQKGVFFAGMTGYYSSALWVGHDNYKALSSKSTGSGAAAPLWQAYMNKIHKGLPNRNILDGNGSDYGLVKVKTCAVSGQLATDACEHDVMGYGTVTDWWAKGTEPTVYCQMHTSQEVCVESGEPAGPYCTNKDIRGVITVPVGHPLYKFIGTRYEDVLKEYLGSAASVGGGYCSLHTNNVYTGGMDWNTTEYDPYNPYDAGSDTGTSVPAVSQTDTVITQDARTLIEVAYAQIAGMDPTSEQYAAIWVAADNLQAVLNSGSASQIAIEGAMGNLSRAMAGIY